jgi:hypothetical protein
MIDSPPQPDELYFFFMKGGISGQAAVDAINRFPGNPISFHDR